MATPGLTEHEKVAVRAHCGYVGVTGVQTFVLGVPAALETQFMIEGAMDQIMPQALPRVRQLIGILDQLEGQMVEDAELAAVNKLGEIEINQKEQRQLFAQYNYWVAALCNLLGITRNPFDQRLTAPGMRGINATVQH